MEYFSNLKAKLIYVFRIPDATHLDCVKIGEATFEDGNITLPPNSSAPVSYTHLTLPTILLV